MEAPACHTAALHQALPGKRPALAAYWTASMPILPAWESSLYSCRETYKRPCCEPCSYLAASLCCRTCCLQVSKVLALQSVVKMCSLYPGWTLDSADRL